METKETGKKIAKRARGNGAGDLKPQKHAGGRPSKFTPERRQKIIEALRTGATYKAVAHYARISYECLRDWVVKGSTMTNENDEYFKFLQDFREAEGSLAVRSLA